MGKELLSREGGHRISQIPLHTRQLRGPKPTLETVPKALSERQGTCCGIHKAWFSWEPGLAFSRRSTKWQVSGAAATPCRAPGKAFQIWKELGGFWGRESSHLTGVSQGGRWSYIASPSSTVSGETEIYLGAC